MLPEKWKNIIGEIKDKFNVVMEGEEHLAEEGGIDIEYIEFDGPPGRMRLEYVTKPVVIDKKVKYSNRIGSESAVSYVYSDTEKNQKLKVYKKGDEEEWTEIDTKNFNIT